MEKKLTIQEVYKSIAHQRELIKQTWDNREPLPDDIKSTLLKEKWQEVISAYAWVMSLMEDTEEINPTK